MLNEAQRARFDELMAERRTVSRGQVWTLDERGKPKSINVRLGLTDGTYTELVGGALKEGTELIVGTASVNAGRSTRGGGSPRFF